MFPLLLSKDVRREAQPGFLEVLGDQLSIITQDLVGEIHAVVAETEMASNSVPRVLRLLCHDHLSVRMVRNDLATGMDFPHSRNADAAGAGLSASLRAPS